MSATMAAREPTRETVSVADDFQTRVLDALREIRADVTAIRLLALGHHGPRDAADEHLLRAIAASALGTRFSAREVFRHRRVAPTLASALQDADIVSVIQLGKLLKRLSGSAVDGVRLEQIDARVAWGISGILCGSDRRTLACPDNRTYGTTTFNTHGAIRSQRPRQRLYGNCADAGARRLACRSDHAARNAAGRALVGRRDVQKRGR
jgi:hypothetical protein